MKGREYLRPWFLERYHKDGDEILTFILPTTGDKTWVSFVNVETKAQSAVIAVDAHTFTKQAEELQQKLSACQKADSNCFLGHERSAGIGIHATRDHNNVRSVFRNTEKKNCGRVGHSEQKAWNADILCTAAPWQCASAYSRSHKSTAGACQLGVVPPYSPYLSRSDQHLFSYLKNWLPSQHINNNE
jgi:hypothetical protein